MNFLQITNDELNKIDLSPYVSKINSSEYQNYFISESGQEHYRLLSHISKNNESINILDVGTLKGCSALAFSVNKTNKITSFNITHQLDLNSVPENIEFKTDNIINGNYNELILNSKYIMLDTYHDGIFEQEFVDYLTSISYVGYLILDDIHLNNEMEKFWSSIPLEKYDITNIGHSTGTGVVIFK